MMGVGPSEAGRMTYWQYTAMRHVWNARHKPEGADDEDNVEPPSVEFVRERMAMLEAAGISGSTH